SFEISFTDALILMPKFASTLKALIGNKEKLSEMAWTTMNEHCLAVILNKLPRKLGDPGKFLIPCKFSGMDECLALADLGASINLMPFSVWKALSLPELTPTCMTLELADRSVSKPIGIAKDVSFKVGVFHFPADFMVVDFEPDPRVPLILGRCFLKTIRALIDVHKGELTLRIGMEAITYNLDQTVRYSANYNQMTANRIDFVCEEYSQEVLGFSDTTELKVCEAKTIKSSVDEPPEVELKDLPHHLEYAFLEGDNKLPVIIAKELGSEEKAALIKVLKSHKRAIVWKLFDIQDGFSGYFQIPIDPRDQEKTTFTCPYGTFAYCRMPFGLFNAPGTFQRFMLAIFHDMVEKTMEVFMDDFSVFGNSFENCLSRLDKVLQRCEDTNLSLNWEKSHFMVKEGIVLGHKISKNGIEVDRAKVDVIPNLPHPTTVKGGFTVVENEENELIPIRLVTEWRVCIDYRKLNKATRKDHFPLPFMDEMLERLVGNEYYCFLDGFSGYFQIPIDPCDQEKTTFTCPYGTFAYRRMPLRLYNAPDPFQRCMLAIFHDMVEKTMEVFMDDLSVFENSFENCLSCLDKMLQWIEVDRAKVNVIAKLPYPTTIKENLAADHLSRLDNPYKNMLDPKEINENFSLETLGMVTFRGDSSTPWFADFANYHAGNFIIK
nr:reverse transcriptase domain-containing protein [Tanacetum cinerariifolium]